MDKLIDYMRDNDYGIAGLSSKNIGGIPVVMKEDFFICNFHDINHKCIGRGWSYWNIQDKEEYLKGLPDKIQSDFRSCYSYGEELFDDKKKNNLIKQDQDDFFCNSTRYSNTLYLTENDEGEIYLDNELYDCGEKLILGKLYREDG